MIKFKSGNIVNGAVDVMLAVPEITKEEIEAVQFRTPGWWAKRDIVRRLCSTPGFTARVREHMNKGDSWLMTISEQEYVTILLLRADRLKNGDAQQPIESLAKYDFAKIECRFLALCAVSEEFPEPINATDTLFHGPEWGNND